MDEVHCVSVLGEKLCKLCVLVPIIAEVVQSCDSDIYTVHSSRNVLSYEYSPNSVRINITSYFYWCRVTAIGVKP